MDDSQHEIVDLAIDEVEHQIQAEEDVPFLKTCPKCQSPLRANEHEIVVVLEAFNTLEFTDVRYYCRDHYPDPEAVTEKLLTSYGVILTITVVEPSPNCEPSAREVVVEDVAYDVPARL